MKAWFLVVLFYTNPDAKIAPFKTEAECNKAIPTAIKEFKGDKDVRLIFCSEGNLSKGVEPEKDGWL